MRTIAVVTVGRSDYGIYVPILREIQARKSLALQLIVSGAHLLPEFGRTAQAIEQDGFPIAARIEMHGPSDSPEAIAVSIGRGAIGFARAFAKSPPDILLLLGDRFEMLAAACAALPFTMPVAHIHGGELTQGAIDDSIRHAITKMSHLHFVATETYRRRVVQLGEEPWRVTVSGAPGLDNLRSGRIASREELLALPGVNLTHPFLLVTYHSTTLEPENTDRHLDELLAALDEFDFGLVFTYPNADSGGRAIIERIEPFVGRRPNRVLVESLGTAAYFGLMRHASAMVGNSSSGLVEAASLRLPVVNVGNRQRGRVRPRNVVDVECARDEIVAAVRAATAPGFAASLADLANPYGDGRAAPRIVDVLERVPIDVRLITKSFYDLESVSV